MRRIHVHGIIVASLAVVLLCFTLFGAGPIADDYYRLPRYMTNSTGIPPTKAVTETDGPVTEKNILVAVHTYGKNMHFVAEAKGHWLRGIETYAFSDEYSENATKAGVHVVKFKDEFPNTAQNFLADGRSTLAFGYLREVLDRDESLHWILFGDDDTYFHLPKVLTGLRLYNPNEKWILCQKIHLSWCYGGEGRIVSRGALLAISPLQMWEAPGKYSSGGGDTRVSHMLQEMGNADLTNISDWHASRHRVKGETAEDLCKEDGRCA